MNSRKRKIRDESSRICNRRFNRAVTIYMRKSDQELDFLDRNSEPFIFKTISEETAMRRAFVLNLLYNDPKKIDEVLDEEYGIHSDCSARSYSDEEPSLPSYRRLEFSQSSFSSGASTTPFSSQEEVFPLPAPGLLSVVGLHKRQRFTYSQNGETLTIDLGADERADFKPCLSN